MYQAFDDDDLEFFETDVTAAGAPDPGMATSMSLWMHGLLEDPLRDPTSSESEKNKGMEESEFLTR